MTTSDPELITTSVGLRKWAMDVGDAGGLLRDLAADLAGTHSFGGCGGGPTSSGHSAGRLLLENDAPDDEAATAATAAGTRGCFLRGLGCKWVALRHAGCSVCLQGPFRWSER